MSLIHLHRWVTTSEAFTPGLPGAEIERASAEIVLRFAFGFTSIRQACAGCGAARVTEAIGDVRSESAKEVAW